MKINDVSEKSPLCGGVVMTFIHSNRWIECPNTRNSIGNGLPVKKYVVAQRIQKPVSALVWKREKKGKREKRGNQMCIQSCRSQRLINLFLIGWTFFPSPVTWKSLWCYYFLVKPTIYRHSEPRLAGSSQRSLADRFFASEMKRFGQNWNGAVWAPG